MAGEITGKRVIEIELAPRSMKKHKRRWNVFILVRFRCGIDIVRGI